MTTFGEIGGNERVLFRVGNVIEEVIGNGESEEVVSYVPHEGRYYKVEWERGLTEYTEHKFPEDDEKLEEVFPHNVITIEQKLVFTDDPKHPNKDTPILSDEIISSLATIGLGDELRDDLHRLYSADVKELREALSNTEILRLDTRTNSFFRAVEMFLDEFVE